MVDEKLKNVNQFIYLGRIALTPRKFNQLLSWTIVFYQGEVTLGMQFELGIGEQHIIMLHL